MEEQLMTLAQHNAGVALICITFLIVVKWFKPDISAWLRAKSEGDKSEGAPDA